MVGLRPVSIKKLFSGPRGGLGQVKVVSGLMDLLKI